MAGRIRIAADENRGIFFSIEDARGHEVERSPSYRTICRVESALAKLLAATEQAAPASVASVVSKETPKRRAQQPYSQAALVAARDALVSDERPVGRRRTELSGPLTQFRLHGKR